MSELVVTTRTTEIESPASASIKTKRIMADLALHTEQLLDSHNDPLQLHGTFTPARQEDVPLPLQPLLTIDWHPPRSYTIRARVPFLQTDYRAGVHELHYSTYPAPPDRFGWQLSQPSYIAQHFWHEEQSPPPDTISAEQVLTGVSKVLERLRSSTTLTGTNNWYVSWKWPKSSVVHPPDGDEFPGFVNL